MLCPLCQIATEDQDLIPHPYWQDEPLKLAHSMNLDWDESDGCCKRCFNHIVEAVDQKWVPSKNYRIKGVGDGYRYTLTKREMVFWNHVNPEIQRRWQKNIVDEVGDKAIELGHKEWFIFDVGEDVLAQGRIENYY